MWIKNPFRIESSKTATRAALKGGQKIQWTRGSTFAFGANELHVPHFFWELQALFTLAVYLPDMVNSVLMIANRRIPDERPASFDISAIASAFKPIKGCGAHLCGFPMAFSVRRTFDLSDQLIRSRRPS